MRHLTIGRFKNKNKRPRCIKDENGPLNSRRVLLEKQKTCIETRLEVWGNEKCSGNTRRGWVFPQVFAVLPNFQECISQDCMYFKRLGMPYVKLLSRNSNCRKYYINPTKKHKVITNFVKHFNIIWREMTGSSEKITLGSWISGGEGVGSATPSRRILVDCSVIRYVDIRSVTKAGPVIDLLVHCILLILILSQLHRIVSFDIVEREDKSFTSWSVTARI